jgi:hypothetical protein
MLQSANCLLAEECSGQSHATPPPDDKIESLSYGAAAGMLNAHDTIAVWAMRF